MIRTQVLLTPDLLEIIKEIAEREGGSVSATVRTMLEKGVAKFRKKTGMENLLKMADLASKVGPKDLSSNDDYLYKLLPKR